MSRKLISTVSTILAISLMTLGMAALRGAEGLPNYQLQYLGAGSPAAINNNGVVVGAKINGNNYEPLVSVNGSTWTSLPVPSGATSVFPTDVNDSGVIVGVSYSKLDSVCGSMESNRKRICSRSTAASCWGYLFVCNQHQQSRTDRGLTKRPGLRANRPRLVV